jgi:hypothetical protein
VQLRHQPVERSHAHQSSGGCSTGFGAGAPTVAPVHAMHPGRRADRRSRRAPPGRLIPSDHSHLARRPPGDAPRRVTGCRYANLMNAVVYPFQTSPRCSATSKRTKERCKAPAVRGWNVCRFHGAGGGAPKGRANGSYMHGLYTRQAEAAAIDFGSSPAMPQDNFRRPMMQNSLDDVVGNCSTKNFFGAGLGLCIHHPALRVWLKVGFAPKATECCVAAR